ncbi:hypothetical protein FPK48_21915, partial [Acinetobacter baumannii]|nr:hypothetical protein [Acinetobacter baumannii]
MQLETTSVPEFEKIPTFRAATNKSLSSPRKNLYRNLMAIENIKLRSLLLGGFATLLAAMLI